MDKHLPQFNVAIIKSIRRNDFTRVVCEYVLQAETTIDEVADLLEMTVDGICGIIDGSAFASSDTEIAEMSAKLGAVLIPANIS